MVMWVAQHRRLCIPWQPQEEGVVVLAQQARQVQEQVRRVATVDWVSRILACSLLEAVEEAPTMALHPLELAYTVVVVATLAHVEVCVTQRQACPTLVEVCINIDVTPKCQQFQLTFKSMTLSLQIYIYIYVCVCVCACVCVLNFGKLEDRGTACM